MSRMYFLEPGVSAEDYLQMARDVAIHQLGLVEYEDEDEDCILSDHVADLLIQIFRMLAGLAKKGGKHPLPVLKTLDGRPVKAKVTFNRYERPIWAVMDRDDRVTAYVPYGPAGAEALARFGYKEVVEEVPAAVRVMWQGGEKDDSAGLYPAYVMDTRRKNGQETLVEQEPDLPG